MSQESASLGVVIPVLNEAARLENALAELARHALHEIIVVDGGSQDKSRSIVEKYTRTQSNVKLITSEAGRARQMNAGAAASSADILCFLHADTSLPDEAIHLIQYAVSSNGTWGRFDVRFAEPYRMLRIVAWGMNRRSALTGICTGDQCIWVTRELFEKTGGYADIPLMEDIELSKRLKKLSRPHRIETQVTTSARRWLNNGIVRTIILMWCLRFLYWLGVSPRRLAAMYR